MAKKEEIVEISNSSFIRILSTLFYYADRNNYAMESDTKNRKIISDYGEKARKVIDELIT